MIGQVGTYHMRPGLAVKPLLLHKSTLPQHDRRPVSVLEYDTIN